MPQLTHAELDRFTHELGSFVRSGMPLPDALRQLASQLPPGRLKELSAGTAVSVEQGTPLSDALEKGSHRLPPQFIALVRCGEITGDMHGVLEFAMQQSRRVTIFRAGLVTALVYPVLLILLAVTLLTFVATFITPQFESIFTQLGAELPQFTQLAMRLSHLLYGVQGMIILAALATAAIIPVFSPLLRDRLLNAVSQFPGFAILTATGDTALYTRFLAEMLPRGVPLHTALRAASLAVTMAQTRRHLQQMSAAAERGNTTHECLAPLTPATAAFLFRQGELNGRLAEACANIGAYCEERYSRTSKQAHAIMEPLLIAAVSVLIGLFVLSLYLPLFSIPKLVR